MPAQNREALDDALARTAKLLRDKPHTAVQLARALDLTPTAARYRIGLLRSRGVAVEESLGRRKKGARGLPPLRYRVVT